MASNTLNTVVYFNGELKSVPENWIDPNKKDTRTMNNYVTHPNSGVIVQAQQFNIPSTGIPEGWPVSTFDPRAVQPGDWIVTANYESDNPAYFVVPNRVFDLLFTPMMVETKLDANGEEVEVQVTLPVDDSTNPTPTSESSVPILSSEPGTLQNQEQTTLPPAFASPTTETGSTKSTSSTTSLTEQPSEKNNQDSTQ